MTRLGKRDRANAARTAELYGKDPDAVIKAQAMVAEMAKATIMGAVAGAATRGIGELAIVNSLMQFSAGYLNSIHPGATVNALRLTADQIEAHNRNDREAEARACEALMINGLSFTAALEAERKGGRN